MNQGSRFTIPIAIVVAGLLIAGALYLANRDTSLLGSNKNKQDENKEYIDTSFRAVSGNDYVLGNPDADVILLEYSDLECPFCKDYHTTLHRIVDEYGKDGRVAWVYRHFPLEQLHSQAPKEAEAAECAGALGGNSAFWAYIDNIFEVTPSNNGLNLALLPQIAEDIGLDRAAFEKCLENETYADEVETDYQEAIALGGRGTPYTMVIVGDQRVPIEGAQPYENMRQVIEGILQTIPSSSSSIIPETEEVVPQTE